MMRMVSLVDLWDSRGLGRKFFLIASTPPALPPHPLPSPGAPSHLMQSGCHSKSFGGICSFSPHSHPRGRPGHKGVSHVAKVTQLGSHGPGSEPQQRGSRGLTQKQG